jgi:hypothetical protein
MVVVAKRRVIFILVEKGKRAEKSDSISTWRSILLFIHLLIYYLLDLIIKYVS